MGEEDTRTQMGGTTVLGMLLLTCAVAVGSALLPVISVEVFVVALSVVHPPHTPPWWAIGIVVALGQLAGKLLYFYAARGDIRLPRFIHEKTMAAVDNGHGAVITRAGNGTVAWLGRRGRLGLALHDCARWIARRWAWLRKKCHAHPKWMFATQLVSSVLGIPPFMITTVLAGLSGMTLRAFLVASVPGRFARFSILAASPAILVHVHHFHHLPYFF